MDGEAKMSKTISADEMLQGSGNISSGTTKLYGLNVQNLAIDEIKVGQIWKANNPHEDFEILTKEKVPGTPEYQYSIQWSSDAMIGRLRGSEIIAEAKLVSNNNDPQITLQPKPDDIDNVHCGQVYEGFRGKYEVVWRVTTPEPYIRLECIEEGSGPVEVGFISEYTAQHIPQFFLDFTLIAATTKKKTPLFQVDFDRDNPSEDYDDAFDTIKRMIEGSS